MQRPKCLKPETLLEYISLPEEFGRVKAFRVKLHLRRCADCQKVESQIRQQCDSYFAPQPEITSSLLRVYSRLQKDETLILKGWKLDTARPQRSASQRLLAGGWLFRGSLAAASIVIVGVLTLSRNNAEEDQRIAARRMEPKVPMAQIRIEQPGRVKVHYVEPELLQTMEFETTSARY